MIQKLGKYKIVDKIGEGAMGSVYKAYDSILDRNVAIKIMAEDIKWNPELKLRFYREARAAASLHHSNIVTVYDLGEEGKTTFIVMECLQGKNLKEIIQEKISIPLEKKLSIIAQVADGLNHAHQAGFIHRDIKPGNIFVTSTGTSKILDFGIAHIPASNLTRVGDRLGTPIYMSPELVRGAKYDARSDIFSAGIVFYEFLTYVHPFRDAKFDKTLNNILYLEKLPFNEHFPDAPPELWTILSSCLAKEPDKRYASMAEAAAACRSLIEKLNEASQKMIKELTAALPNLRLESQRPNAPAKLTRLWAEAQDLLNREQKPDYISLVHLTTALSEEPLFRSDMASAVPHREDRPAQPAGASLEITQKIITPKAAEASILTPRPSPPPPKPDRREPAVPPPNFEQPARTLVDQMMGSSKETAPASTGAGAQSDDELKERRTAAEVEAMMAEGRLEEALDRIRTAMGELGPRDLLVKMLTDARRKIEERKQAHVSEFLDSAKAALEAKEYTKAIESLDKVLELDPDKADAIEMRRAALAEIEAEKLRRTRREEGERAKAAGFKLLAEKKFRESLRTFKQAAELMGEDSTIKVGMDEAEAGVKEEDLLVKVQSEFAQAQTQFQTGDLSGARTRAHRVLELSPRNSEARELLSQIDRAQEEKSKRDALAALINQSREALKQRDFEDALSLANDALQQDPANPQIRDLIQSIHRTKEEARRRREVDQLLIRADAALSRKDFDDAESQVRSALVVIPDFPDALAYRKKIDQAKEQQRIAEEVEKALSQAEQAYQQGDLNQCENLARHALTLNSREGRAAELLRRSTGAREARKREQIAALLTQGTGALKAGDLQTAAQCAADVLQIETRNPEAEQLQAGVKQAEMERRQAKIAEFLSRSREALAQGRFETAAGLANEVLSLEPKHKEAKALGKEIAKARKASEKELGRQQKEFEKAEKVYSDEDVTEGAAAAGKTYLLETPKPAKKNRFPILIACGAIALLIAVGFVVLKMRSREKAAPPAPVFQVSDAKSYLDQKNFDKAIEVAQKILAVSPADGQAKAILAEAQKQKKQSAIEVFMLEAQNYRSLGQFEESLNSIQNILNLDPNYQPALDVRLQIQDEMAANEAKSVQNENIRNSLTRAASIMTACKLAEASGEIGAIKGEQDKDIQKRLAKTRSLLDACKLKDAKIVIDRAKRTDPTIPEIDALGKQWSAKSAEFTRIQADLNKWSSAVGVQKQIEELSSRAESLFKQAKYTECQDVLNQWLSLDSQNRQAEALSAQVGEARESVKAYEAAMAARRVPDALSALDRLEKAHPSNPDLAEYRQKAEALKRSAKATLNILRLNEAGSLTLDDKPIGSEGEVVNTTVSSGAHTLVIKNSSGKQKTVHFELYEGTNPTFVYNLATMEFSPMTESDREVMRVRKERERNRSFAVQHTHGLLRGSCSGELVINGFRIEYRANQPGGHHITHSFADLKLDQDNDKLQFVEVSSNKDLATFKARSAAEAKSIKEWWDYLEKLGK